MKNVRTTLYLLVHAVVAFVCGAIVGLPVLFVVGILFLAAAFFAYRLDNEEGQDERRIPASRRASAASREKAEQPMLGTTGVANASTNEDDELAEQVERLQQTIDGLTKEVERLRGLESSGPAGADADGLNAAENPEEPRMDVTFRLSDLKTGMACEPLDERADPMAVAYEKYKPLFEEDKDSAFVRDSAVPKVPASEDHMRSPLQKPSGDVVRDEQTAIREIMRYLWGHRQQAVRAGKQMYALDLRKSIWAGPGYLRYEYYSYSTQSEACYDGGVCSVAGENETITREIVVKLISDNEYARRREEACVTGQAHLDDRQRFAYDGELAFEEQTEAFVWKAASSSVPVLYLQRPFGMKGCLTIKDF